MSDTRSSSSADNVNERLVSILLDTNNSEEYLRTVLEYVPVLVSAVDLEGNVKFASQHHTLLAGVSDDLNDIQKEADLYPALVQSRVENMAMEAALNQPAEAWELSAKHKDGSMHHYHMHRLYVKRDTDTIIYSIGTDVTEFKLAERALRDHKSRIDYMAFHDPLTGLANRSLFYDRANKSLSRANRSHSTIALLLIDLDRFKLINDSFGHDFGDAFLKKAAQHLLDELRDTDTVARLGGDEFVVILENIRDVEDVEKIAGKILKSLAEPMTIQGHDISCSGSIGISMYPNHGKGIDQLLKNADAAMYNAKNAGKNCYQFFVHAMTDNAVNYLLLENDLRRAIECNEMKLFYQPQVDLNTGRIVGLEALVRWQHKDRGLVSPVHFIPLAEETGLINQLGEWVLSHACERFQAWLMQGIHFGKVAVNISMRQFRQDHFEQTVVRVLTESKLAPQYLELEITESSAMENASVTAEMLGCLSKMGLSLAIDDFGTGYSSLAYLQQFPIHKLKIDRSFVSDIDTNNSDASIAKSIIDLAHNMQLQVIAEGVERPAQSRWLIDRGCDQVQGFYYCKPLAEEELLALVEDHTRVIKDAAGVRFIL
ncbi:EAL domain-containing protein [Teredinibacter sp. KSP-S5-2]|uniref:sensor domain-containing protein n=1 Tax=Teredinibacter sp. KSP-S5-2 TaxID=3034506 RepID=UPI00293508EF|nr:EAL domain-containing protein [Teredinibacter sp. KSP-S5-2]WNO09520.1 EAL domain-containing protein [Teredinibacter sp. KSP-S5-2]